MGDRKTIAFLCHPYHRGGVTRWMADAAIAYAKAGHQVYFLTVEPIRPFISGVGRETMLELLERAPVGITIIKIRAGFFFEFGTSDYRAFIYKQLFTKLPLGTPVILSDDSAVWQAACSLHYSFPVIGVIHSDNSYYYDLAVKYCKEITLIACVSQRVKKTVVSLQGASYKSNAYVIPCGINLPPVNTTDEANDVLRLIYVGRIVNEAKRTGDLVKISASLLKKNIKFHLDIIGDGEVKIALKQKFKEESLTDCVMFHGWLSQKKVTGYLRQSDVLLLTSDFEGMPIVMMEGLASGCGFAGTRVSGIEDYEQDPLAANCFSVYNVGDIEDAVAKIINLGATAVGIRQKAARHLAETHFSMQVCIQKYNEAIDAIPARSYTAIVVRLSPVKIARSHMISLARFFKVKFSR